MSDSKHSRHGHGHTHGHYDTTTGDSKSTENTPRKECKKEDGGFELITPPTSNPASREGSPRHMARSTIFTNPHSAQNAAVIYAPPGRLSTSTSHEIFPNYAALPPAQSNHTTGSSLPTHHEQAQGVHPHPFGVLANVNGQSDWVFDNVAALKAWSVGTDVKDGQILVLRGYFTVGDLGAGQLYVDRQDTSTSANGGTVFVTANGIRVKRVIDDTSIVIAEWFGLVSDGVTDNSNAINAAIQVSEGKTLKFLLSSRALTSSEIGVQTWSSAGGVYACAGLNVNVSNIVIQGNRTKLLLPPNTLSEGQNFFQVSNFNKNLYNITIDGFIFNCDYHSYVAEPMRAQVPTNFAYGIDGLTFSNNKVIRSGGTSIDLQSGVYQKGVIKNVNIKHNVFQGLMKGAMLQVDFDYPIGTTQLQISSLDKQPIYEKIEVGDNFILPHKRAITYPSASIPAWDANTTYQFGSVVFYQSRCWYSLINNNKTGIPTAFPYENAGWQIWLDEYRATNTSTRRYYKVLSITYPDVNNTFTAIISIGTAPSDLTQGYQPGTTVATSGLRAEVSQFARLNFTDYGDNLNSDWFINLPQVVIPNTYSASSTIPNNQIRFDLSNANDAIKFRNILPNMRLFASQNCNFRNMMLTVSSTSTQTINNKLTGIVTIKETLPTWAVIRANCLLDTGRNSSAVCVITYGYFENCNFEHNEVYGCSRLVYNFPVGATLYNKNPVQWCEPGKGFSIMNIKYNIIQDTYVLYYGSDPGTPNFNAQFSYLYVDATNIASKTSFVFANSSNLQLTSANGTQYLSQQGISAVPTASWTVGDCFRIQGVSRTYKIRSFSQSGTQITVNFDRICLKSQAVVPGGIYNNFAGTNQQIYKVYSKEIGQPNYSMDRVNIQYNTIKYLLEILVTGGTTSYMITDNDIFLAGNSSMAEITGLEATIERNNFTRHYFEGKAPVPTISSEPAYNKSNGNLCIYTNTMGAIGAKATIFRLNVFNWAIPQNFPGYAFSEIFLMPYNDTSEAYDHDTYLKFVQNIWINFGAALYQNGNSNFHYDYLLVDGNEIQLFPRTIPYNTGGDSAGRICTIAARKQIVINNKVISTADQNTNVKPLTTQSIPLITDPYNNFIARFGQQTSYDVTVFNNFSNIANCVASTATLAKIKQFNNFLVGANPTS